MPRSLPGGPRNDTAHGRLQFQGHHRLIWRRAMQYRKTAIAVVAAMAATLTVATPASAAWRGGGGWHHGGGWNRGAGIGLGFATGAIVGSALAAPYYGGYGYGYGPYAYGDG